MAYSPEFMAKIAQKPSHLTPSEASRVFATMRGWEYRSPQHENERYQNMVTEVIETCPGLSLILDVNAGETIADRTAQISKSVVMTPSSVGFTRRSRRRYSITMSFPEQMFILKNASPVNVDFYLDGLVWDTEDSSGAPLTQTDSSALPSLLHLQIVGSATENVSVGRLVFDIPTFNADPAKVHVTLGNNPGATSSHTPPLRIATDYTGSDISPGDLVDETGRKYNLSTASPKLDTTAIRGMKIEMVNPTTTDPR